MAAAPPGPHESRIQQAKAGIPQPRLGGGGIFLPAWIKIPRATGKRRLIFPFAFSTHNTRDLTPQMSASREMRGTTQTVLIYVQRGRGGVLANGAQRSPGTSPP